MGRCNFAFLFVCLYLLDKKGQAEIDLSTCYSDSNETKCMVCQGNSTCLQICPDGYYNVYVPRVTCHDTTHGPDNTSIEPIFNQGMSHETSTITTQKSTDSQHTGQGTLCVKCDPDKHLNENTTLHKTCLKSCLASYGRSDEYFTICKITKFGHICVQICPNESRINSVTVLSAECEPGETIDDNTLFIYIAVGAGGSLLAVILFVVTVCLLRCMVLRRKDETSGRRPELEEYKRSTSCTAEDLTCIDENIGIRPELQGYTCDAIYAKTGKRSGRQNECYSMEVGREYMYIATAAVKCNRRECSGEIEMGLIQHGTVQRQSEDLLNLNRPISDAEVLMTDTELALKSENYEASWLLLQKISRRLKIIEGDNCVEVFPAYRKGYRWEPIFVVVSNQEIEREHDLFMGYPVYRRMFGAVSHEAKLVIQNNVVQDNLLSLDDLRTVKRAISSACLHEKHKMITLISACPFRSKRGGSELVKELCIVVHCLVKGLVPFNEEPFPDEVEGIPVDVREGYCQPCVVRPPGSRRTQPSPGCMPVQVDDVMSPIGNDNMICKDIKKGQRSKDFNPTLLMGTCIGPIDGEGSGTLGGFVVLKDGNIGGLTCAHVAQNNKLMSQPAGVELRYSSSKQRCVFGELYEQMFYPGSVDKTGIDAAIIKITDRKPVDGQFVSARREQLKFAGFDPNSPPRFSKGKILSFQDLTSNNRHTSIIKSGAETGLTCGRLYLDGLYVRMFNREMRLPNSNQTVEFFNQMEVTSVLGPSTTFFSLGDSGSLAFMPLKDSELQCIGLCVGCTSYGSCVVTPIEEVFNNSTIANRFIDFTT